MIAIVDYGAGNLVSVKKAIDYLDQDSAITADPAVVRHATKIVLPGVGNFAATATLSSSGLQDAITAALQRRIPFLGICVGMQWMFAGSTEAPKTPGLSLFPGDCVRFPSNVKSPHVGWNRIEISSTSRLFRGLAPNPFVYFTHSYHAPLNGSTVAYCDYGGKFAAAVEKDFLFGVQFHLEKSGETGLRLLANFCAI
jgi:imidazole glycerol-phosphate synthase subunit HisH